MRCPKCKSLNVYVRDTYTMDDAQTQKRICNDCGVVITTVTAIVNIDPPRGHGAAAMARRIKKAPGGALEITRERSLSFRGPGVVPDPTGREASESPPAAAQ